ncbi:MAG: hypothetical protein MJZ66_06305 [Bacteroidales bacterium]|nr:hypothetical protein [Bacteroidales bacterium]
MTLAAGLLCLSACKPGPEKIQQQIDSAMKINHDIDSAYQVLTYSFESYVPSAMDAALDGLKTYVSEAAKRLDDLQGDNKELEKALREKINVMAQLAQKECTEQVRLYKISEVEFTESNRNEWDNYAKQAEKKISEANAKVNKAYSKIAKKQ